MAKLLCDNKEYLEQIKTDILPQQYTIKGLRRTNTGLYMLDPSTSIDWNTGELQNKFNESLGYQKFVPFYMGVKVEKGVYEPVFVRCWDGRDALDNIVVSSALNIYPTPLQAYGVAKVDGLGYSKVGAATIDLNNLKHPETNKPVESMRLDTLLHAMGVHRDIESFQDFQNLLTNSPIFEYLTPRAVVQLGLCSFFIPNAIGETDANSRNIIMLKDEETGKYDVVVRIDAEANTYLNDKNNQRSGKRKLPKGIYRAEETMDEFLGNIKSRPLDIDWDLFSGFVGLAQMMTSRSNIDNAITKSCITNSVSYMQPDESSYFSQFRRQTSPVCSAYSETAFFDFSEETINRANRFWDSIGNALGSISRIPPFAEGTSKFKQAIEDRNWNKLAQRQFGEDGKTLGD